MSQKVKLSIFESSKCVYDKNFWGNLRKTFTFSPVLNLFNKYDIKKQNIEYLFKGSTFFFYKLL